MTAQETATTNPKVIDISPPGSAPAKPAALVAQPEANYEIGLDNKNGFELGQRAANLLAKSTLVPKEFQNHMPNCMIALNMAHRIGADPLMVMQNLYVVHGRPSWSAQFLIATFNTCGRFSALRFEFFGEKNKDEWGCRAWSIEKATGERLVGADIDLILAKAEGWYGKAGSKWKTMTQQMLMYRAAAWFVRAYAPELAMGLHTVDENEDIGPPAYSGTSAEAAKGIESVTIDGEVASATEPEKPGLEGFKEKHTKKAAPKPAEAPTSAPETPAATEAPETSAAPPVKVKCDPCVGSGFVFKLVNGKEERLPCDSCEGIGKV